MLNSVTVIYLIASVFGLIWILWFLANLQNLIKSMVIMGILVTAKLVSLFFALLALALFAVSIWFTIAPLGSKNPGLAFSTHHIVGMIITWSMAFLCSTLSGTAYVTDAFIRLITGDRVVDLAVEALAYKAGYMPPQILPEETVTPSNRFLDAAGGAASRGKPIEGPTAGVGLAMDKASYRTDEALAEAPEFIEVSVPDTWFA